MGYRVQAELKALIKRLEDRLATDETLTEEERAEVQQDIDNLTSRLNGS